jgi:hypothetical protein
MLPLCELRVGTAAQPSIPYACLPNKSDIAASVYNCTGASSHQQLAQDTLKFAMGLAEALRSVAGLAEADYPLSFMYALHSDGERGGDCLTSGTGPFYVKGGGPPLCKLIQSVTSPAYLGAYLAALIDMEDASEWEGAVAPMVRNLGLSAWAGFHEAAGPYVYSPVGERWDMVELRRQQLEEGLPYWGMSGGGGSGGGFEVSCVHSGSGHTTTLLTGGGGGGAGMNSPEGGKALRSGGGGGGGAQFAGGWPFLGAGAGNAPAGEVDINPASDAPWWVIALGSLREQLRRCATHPHTHVSLRGGGGGGGGFEAYRQFDGTNASASPVEYEPHALSFGYGFQFALGPPGHTLLEGDLSPDEAAFVRCAGKGSSDCRGCVAPPANASTPSDEAALLSSTRFDAALPAPSIDSIPQVMLCADSWAQLICKHATTPNGTRYTKFGQFTACNCPVAAFYKEQYLPSKPQYAFVRNASNCPVGGTSSLPPLTRSAIAAHAREWCGAEPPTMQLKTGCARCMPLDACRRGL